MASLPEHSSDVRVEIFLGNMLRIGVVIAGLVVLGGTAYHLSQSWSAVPKDAIFRGEPADLREPGLVLDAARQGNSLAWIQVGVLLLIAIPVLRVAFSLFAFAWLRDGTYIVVTLVVLVTLLASIIGGMWSG